MFHGWISRFGVPAVITSDSICSLLNIKHKTTTAFHPQSNGMVERFHRQLKNSLCARLASANWFEYLLWVLLGLHSSPREDSATFASEAVDGSDLTLPSQFLKVQDPPTNLFYENLKNLMSGFQPVPPLHLVIILQQLLFSQKLFMQNFHLAQWFLYVRMDTLLPWLYSTKVLTRFYLAPLKPFSSKLAREYKLFQFNASNQLSRQVMKLQ